MQGSTNATLRSRDFAGAGSKCRDAHQVVADEMIYVTPCSPPPNSVKPIGANSA